MARAEAGRAEAGARADRTAERGEGAAVLAGRVRAGPRAGAARTAEERAGGPGAARTAEGRAQTADPGGVADSRRAGAGADRRTADHWGAQTADGRALVQTADRRRGRRRQTAREQTCTRPQTDTGFRALCP